MKSARKTDVLEYWWSVTSPSYTKLFSVSSCMRLERPCSITIRKNIAESGLVRHDGVTRPSGLHEERTHSAGEAGHVEAWLCVISPFWGTLESDFTWPCVTVRGPTRIKSSQLCRQSVECFLRVPAWHCPNRTSEPALAHTAEGLPSTCRSLEGPRWSLTSQGEGRLTHLCFFCK